MPFFKLKIQILASQDIDHVIIDEMFSLYSPYHHVEKQFFIDRTLHQFSKMVLIRHKTRLIGFFGLRYETIPLTGVQKTAAIYFGQMFILRSFRKNFLVQKLGLLIACRQKLFCPFTQLFIWGDVLNYKVYVLLNHTFPRTYPSPVYPLTTEIRALRNYLGKKYYAGHYNAKTGIVAKTQRRVSYSETRIPPDALSNPLVSYYTGLNQNHQRGDGLIVITPVNLKNVINGFKQYLIFKRKKKNDHTCTN